ncbi:hypothetical protein DXG01_006192, partial [Tephrocybe rancida]
MDPAKVVEWEATCVAWETDPSYPRKAKSPLISEVVCVFEGISEAEVQKELAEAEVERLSGGGTSLHATSASVFLVLGLELEESHWEQLHGVYMPGLLQFLHDRTCAGGLEADTEEQPEMTDLWLPSQLPPDRRHSMCTSNLLEMEAKLRVAQLHDSLEGIRHILRLKARMVQFKNANVQGQRDSTQSCTVISRVYEKARASTAKYRNARERHLVLVGPGEWENNLKLLEVGQGPGRGGTIEDEAVVLPEVPGEGEGENGDKESNGEGEGNEAWGAEVWEDGISFLLEVQAHHHGTRATCWELSWIWTTGHNSSSVDNKDLLCLEWARSRARVNRAMEEVLLLREEMGRALEFLKWKGKWWR